MHVRIHHVHNYADNPLANLAWKDRFLDWPKAHPDCKRHRDALRRLPSHRGICRQQTDNHLRRRICYVPADLLDQSVLVEKRLAKSIDNNQFPSILAPKPQPKDRRTLKECARQRMFVGEPRSL